MPYVFVKNASGHQIPEHQPPCGEVGCSKDEAPRWDNQEFRFGPNDTRALQANVADHILSKWGKRNGAPTKPELVQVGQAMEPEMILATPEAVLKATGVEATKILWTKTAAQRAQIEGESMADPRDRDAVLKRAPRETIG